MTAISGMRARQGRTQQGPALARLRHGALVVVFYLAVTAFYTYPLVFHLPTTTLHGGGGDTQMEASIVAWNAHQILHNPLGIHDLPFYYPYSHTIAYQQPEVPLDGGDGHVLWTDNFDTFVSQAESRRMAERIASLPPGTIVVAGVKTDGGGQLTAEAVAALRSVGGQRDDQRTLWLAHALIGVKGAPPGSAVETSGPGHVTARVGRSRPLAFTLETFALR